MSSFFSTLFGGGAEREAANQNRAAYGQYATGANGFLDTGLNRATGALNTGYGNANDLLSRNYGLYGGLINDGNNILDRGRTDALNAINTGAAGASAAYEPLAALGQKYGKATTLYQDSLGVNGAAGNQNAVDAFHAGPGYQFSLDQGLQALNRRRAAAGMLNSGNADTDAIKFGTGLANQEYGGWQDRLAGFINPELQATSAVAGGRAGIASNLGRDAANIYNADTAARLGLQGAATQGMAGANTAQANNAVALGNALGGLYGRDAQDRVSVLGNQTSGNVSANNLEAQGRSQGARNLLGAGMSLASLAAGGLGGMGGGGLGNFFGGNGSTAGTAGNLFGGGGTLWGNGTGYAVNPWSSGGAMDPYAGGFRQ